MANTYFSISQEIERKNSLDHSTPLQADLAIIAVSDLSRFVSNARRRYGIASSIVCIVSQERQKDRCEMSHSPNTRHLWRLRLEEHELLVVV